MSNPLSELVQYVVIGISGYGGLEWASADAPGKYRSYQARTPVGLISSLNCGIIRAHEVQ